MVMATLNYMVLEQLGQLELVVEINTLILQITGLDFIETLMPLELDGLELMEVIIYI